MTMVAARVKYDNLNRENPLTFEEVVSHLSSSNEELRGRAVRHIEKKCYQFSEFSRFCTAPILSELISQLNAPEKHIENYIPNANINILSHAVRGKKFIQKEMPIDLSIVIDELFKFIISEKGTKNTLATNMLCENAIYCKDHYEKEHNLKIIAALANQNPDMDLIKNLHEETRAKAIL